MNINLFFGFKQQKFILTFHNRSLKAKCWQGYTSFENSKEDGERKYICGGFVLMFGKTNTVFQV